MTATLSSIKPRSALQALALRLLSAKSRRVGACGGLKRKPNGALRFYFHSMRAASVSLAMGFSHTRLLGVVCMLHGVESLKFSLKQAVAELGGDGDEKPSTLWRDILNHPDYKEVVRLTVSIRGSIAFHHSLLERGTMIPIICIHSFLGIVIYALFSIASVTIEL